MHLQDCANVADLAATLGSKDLGRKATETRWLRQVADVSPKLRKKRHKGMKHCCHFASKYMNVSTNMTPIDPIHKSSKYYKVVPQFVS